MSDFKERLSELISEKGVSYKEIANGLGLNASCITQYVRGDNLPTVENLVKLADVFNCSCDYLLGRVEEDAHGAFRPCPPFSERISALQKELGLNSSRFCRIAGISKSRFFEWKNGVRTPSASNVESIAEGLELSVDYVLGRES